MDYLPLRNKVCFILALLGILAICAWHLAVPINLTAVDIGRHIQNGAQICQGHFDVLYRNYYSFTYPDYPFVNHHWFFGLLSFLIYQAAGFKGVSLAYIVLMLVAFLLYFDAARRLSSKLAALTATIIALPLLVDRQEIRPEGVSVLMMGLYLWLLIRWHLKEIPFLSVAIGLLLAQIIWVNTHIFFIMGPFMALTFAFLSPVKDISRRNMLYLAAALLAVSVINPSGIAGALTPLNIFKGFGYRLAENQNVFFMMQRFKDDFTYPWYLLVCAFSCCVIVINWVLSRREIKWPLVILLLVTMAAGIKAVRLINHFGYFYVVVGAYGLHIVQQRLSTKMAGIMSAIMVLIVAFGLAASFWFKPVMTGIGEASGVEQSAMFFKQAGLKGPIFSNYDIGGYLIFHFAGQEKVFVDNRQEAFPSEFFKDVYISMQEREEVWRKVDSQYHFQVIYFYRHDLTPWGQNFLLARVKDENWVPVFVDDYTIIFARRDGVNQAMIGQYALPRSMFGVSSTTGQSGGNLI